VRNYKNRQQRERFVARFALRNFMCCLDDFHNCGGAAGQRE